MGAFQLAQSRQREANESESPAMERSGMMAGFGATRAIRDSRPRSPATGSQTSLGMATVSEVGEIQERSDRNLSVLTAIADVLPVRSIAG